MEFYILDVFAQKKYEGNQLAVFKNAGELSSKEMQKIAREINFSETTFILSEEEEDGGYPVRIFTPGEEVPFAGHPTLGTAFIIQKEILNGKSDKVTLKLKCSSIPVSFDDSSILWMKQKEPSFGEIFSPDIIADILNISTEDMDENFPIQNISTGLEHLIVPIKNLEGVKKSKVKKEKYMELIKEGFAKSILIFSPETYERENHVNVRVFADYYGVAEDPATGSGNGCLAAYLVKHWYFNKSKIDIRSEQGYEIGRPSLLFLRGKKSEGNIEVSVGGQVISVAKGKWLQY